MRKVIVLFLQYDDKKYPCALHYFKKFTNMLSKTTEVTYVTIDNKANDDFEVKLSEDEYLISGDNSLWEFTGWQKGLEFVYKNNFDYDCAIFADDAFLAPAGGSKDISTIVNSTAINKCVYKNIMIGQLIDLNDVIGRVFVESYIRTHCFILSRKTIQKIKTIPTVGLGFIERCIEGLEFKKDVPIGVGIQTMIKNAITKGHSKELYNNPEMFKMKSLAYLNEILLSARVEGLF